MLLDDRWRSTLLALTWLLGEGWRLRLCRDRFEPCEVWRLLVRGGAFSLRKSLELTRDRGLVLGRLNIYFEVEL